MKMRTLLPGAILVLTFFIAALVSFVWTPFDVTKLDIAVKLQSPSGSHWFGTDHFGRDIFSMIMVGARTSIAVAFIAVGIGLLIGVPLGLTAAAKQGGIVDELIMRGNDLVFAFPALLIAIMITAVFGPGAVNAIIAIGIFNIPVFARLTRGAALSLWSREFILAARVAGKRATRISIEHILPNIFNLLIVQGTIQFSLGILAETGTVSIKKLISHLTMFEIYKADPLANVDQLLNNNDSFSYITLYDGQRRYGLCVFDLDSPNEEVVFQQLVHIKKHMNRLSEQWAGCIYFGTVKHHDFVLGRGTYVRVNERSNHADYDPISMTDLGESIVFHDIDGVTITEDDDKSFTLDLGFFF